MPHEATITWTEASPNDAVVGFNIGRASSAAGPFTQLNTSPLPVTPTSYVDTNVVSGNTYWYEVDAVDANGVASNWSTAVSGTIPGPNAPTITGIVTQ